MFYVLRDGQRYGPYAAEAVRDYLAKGSLLATDQVCEDGSSNWVSIGQIFGPPAGTVVQGESARIVPAADRSGGGWAPVEAVERPMPASPPVRSLGRDARPTTAVRKSWPLLVVTLIALCAILVGVYAFFFNPAATQLSLEGSTTIGDALAPTLLKGFLRSEGATEIEEVKKGGSPGPQRRIRAKLPGQWRPVTYSIIANGSGNAFKALAAGKADIGMSSRPVNDTEARLLVAQGDVRSPTCENVVGLDGLAVVINRGNPLNGLTRQQVGSIFAGKITNWAEVGGSPGPIELYGRASDSGTFDTFVALVLGGNKGGFSSRLHVLADGEAISAAVSGNAAGIGYVGLAQTGSAKALELSDGAGTTPLLPSPFTVATEDYILSRRLFFYTLPGHSEIASKFIAYALSPAGQAVVEQVGFVKQMPALESVPVPASAPLSYSRVVTGLRRMSLNFRFRPDSNQLDNKALADMPRALDSLRQNGIHAGVAVLGFADSRGSASQNQRLSEQRAEIVSDRLRAYGIQVQTVGLSSAMPVGDNATAEGREKNRRVEVWAR